MFSKIQRNVLVVLLVSFIVPWVNLKTTKSPVKVVTDYQRDNWKIYVICVDLNRDRHLSVADLVILKNKYVSAFNVDTEEKLEMEYAFDFFWINFILGGNSSETFSEDEFIDYLSKSYLENKNFREHAVLFQDIFMDMIDVDRDGKISKTEVYELYKDFGYPNQKFVEKYFNAYNPTQDKIPAKQMSRAWADFLAGNRKTDNFIRKYMILINGLGKRFKY